MNVSIDWEQAGPVMISSAVPVFGLLFDRGLSRSVNRYYGPSSGSHGVGRAAPHMVRGFVNWWVDLMVYVSSAFSLSLAAAFQDGRREAVAFMSLATMFWTAALVAAVLYEPFDYATKFRWLRRLINRRYAWTSQPKTPPAFVLVQAGNAAALLFTVRLDW